MARRARSRVTPGVAMVVLRFLLLVSLCSQRWFSPRPPSDWTLMDNEMLEHLVRTALGLVN